MRNLVAKEVPNIPKEAAMASRNQPKGKTAIKGAASNMQQKSLSIELPSRMFYDNGVDKRG